MNLVRRMFLVVGRYPSVSANSKMSISRRLEFLFIMVGLALGIVATSSLPSQAARPCVENFTERGDWSDGKTFKSFVDVKGTTADKAYIAIGRGMTKEGLLGVAVSKDLGLVSAYQEDNGKKSPYNVTVTETDPGTLRIEWALTLAKGLRAPVGFIRDLACNMLEVTLPPGERTDTASDASISLKGEGAGKPLKSVVGQFRKAGFDVFIKYYFDFSGAKSEVRVAEKHPVLLVRAKANPAKSYVLVKCDSDKGDDKRSVKVGSFGKLLKMGFTGAGELQPDEDWIVPVTSTEVGPGLWNVVPSQELNPGEYGLWEVQGYGVALFGID